jgi:hypothetical protein
MPGIPPEDMGLPPLEEGAPLEGAPGEEAMPGEELGMPAASADEDRKPADNASEAGAKGSAHADRLRSSIWDKNDTYGEWQKHEVADLVTLFKDFDARDVKNVNDSLWIELLVEPDVKTALADHDTRSLWDAAEGWLVDHGYPAKQILQLEDILKAENCIDDALRHFRGQLDELENQVADNTKDPNFFIGAS